MNKEKVIFSLSVVPIILIVLIFYMSILLIDSLLINFSIINLGFLILILWFGILLIQQSYFLINKEGVLFPSESFKKGKFFNKRKLIKPLDIKSIGYDNNFYDIDGNKSDIGKFIISNAVGTPGIHRPQFIIVELISGEKKRFAMKIYTKNSVRKLIRLITEVNPNIIILDELKNELSL
jgi:hypothetical protein